MAEIQADQDALRAEFAMSTRRLEITVDELKNKHTTALAELGRKGNAINRLEIERETKKSDPSRSKPRSLHSRTNSPQRARKSRR